MTNFLLITFVSLVIVGSALSVPTVPASGNPKEKAAEAFVPHSTNLGADNYVDNQAPETGSNGMMPTAREVICWLITRVGGVLLGTAVLFVLGGFFNALVCSMTSFCSYDLIALSSMDQESVRALITPDKISTAAALVQDAIGKYNRLQREIRN